MTPTLTGPLARAARALAQLPRGFVARKAGLDKDLLEGFEEGRETLDADGLARLLVALEEGGAVFIAEDSKGGIGVRLKFTSKDVRAINRMEGEGGPVGYDDV